MEGTGGNSSSTMSASIVNKLRKELGKLTPELERKLTKCLNETFEEKHLMVTSSLSTKVDASVSLLERSEQPTLPPLVIQLVNPERENQSVILGMMINGQPEVLKTEMGSTNNPALGLLNRVNATPRPFGINPQQFQTVDLKEFGLFNLPRAFFNAFLFRKLKMTAESQCKEDFCQVAILAVPMITKCAQRLRLKESAILAGFKDVYLISAEGLAAYYWFTKKKEEIKQNKYSKDTVIIDLFGLPVVYRSSFDADTEGKKILVVKAILFFELFSKQDKEEDTFHQMVKKLKIIQNKSLIPVISEIGDASGRSYFGKKYKTSIAIVRGTEVKNFAVKGAALLSENIGNIGSQIENMIGTTVTIEPNNEDGVKQGRNQLGQEVTQHDRVLPAKLTFNMKHDKAKYRIYQTCLRKTKEIIGYLAINGVKLGAELEVACELDWESIWKVVGVSARNPSQDDDQGYKAVTWDWLIGDKVDVAHFGSNSYEECKSLLLKILPSTSQAVEYVRLPKEHSSDDGIENYEVEAVGLDGSSSASSGDRSGIQKRKRSTKSRIIRPNDIIVNTGLKKIKLESDWVDPVVKIEQDSMEDFGEGENRQQVNFKEDEKVEIEEGVVKVEVKEEDLTD